MKPHTNNLQEIVYSRRASSQGGFFKEAKLRHVKYLNNLLEQDHRPVKRQHHFSMGYHSLERSRSTIDGIESMHMIFKGQITVNVIMPGYTKTKRLKEFKIPEETLIQEIPAKSLGNPEEFGALAAYLGGLIREIY